MSQSVSKHHRPPAPGGASHPFGAPTRMIDVGHSRVPYWKIGQGPDVLFVHGWPLHAATFRHLVAEWKGEFTCHLFDLPGTGLSEWDADSQIGLSAHVKSLRAVASALQLERYALVAHDSGAALARILAVDNPAVSCQVYGNTEIPGHHPPLVKLYLLAGRIPGAAAAFGKSLRFRAFQRSALGFGGCFADPDYLLTDFGDLFVKPLWSDARVRQGQFRLLDGFDWAMLDQLAELHTRIPAPALLVWGPDDPFFPLDKVPDMLPQFAGGATFHELSQGKLFGHEDQADEFSAVAVPFMRMHAVAGRS